MKIRRPAAGCKGGIIGVTCIGVAGSFSEGGQPFCPAKIQNFPAKKFSCQGGPSSPILSCQAAAQSYSAKLFCQWAKIADKWLKNMQNWKKIWKIWKKPTKNGRTLTKIREIVAECEVLQVIFCQASHFCPAKHSFLSCQAPIFVLPSFPFCPAKLNNFSRGGQGPLAPPPQAPS